MKIEVKGSSTIEMAYLLPIFFLMFQCIVFALFYYHDKNILSGALYETAVAGTQRVRMGETEETNITTLLEERISGKLLLFGSAQKEAVCDKKGVEVTATVRKGIMSIHMTLYMPVTEPEREVRRIRSIKNTVLD